MAQPFGWLALCAVKTLVLTLGFYFVEHRVRRRERRRNILRDKIFRLQALIEAIRTRIKQETLKNTIVADPENGSTNSLYSPTSPTFTDFQREGMGLIYRRSGATATRPGGGNSLSKDAELEQLEFQLAECKSMESLFHSCGPLPNIIDMFTSLFASLCGFKHQSARMSFKHRVRNNTLAKDFDQESMIELLLFVLLEETRDHIDAVAAFAHYYEWNMCNNRSWVVRQRPLHHEGSDKISQVMAAELARVHGQLRLIFNAFQKTHLATIPLEHLKQLESGLLSRRSNYSVAADVEVSTAESSPLLPSKETENQSMNAEQEFLNLVRDFNKLHTTVPNSFEYAILDSRRVDAQLQPSSILLTLSLIQSVVTLFLYIVDVYLRSKDTPISSLQIYESIYFMVFNSSLPSSLLVNAIFHADLSPAMRATTVRGWLWHVFSSPFVSLSLLVLAPALVTHIIPGMFLYFWGLMPLLALPIGIEYIVRQKARRPSRRLVVVRVGTRIFILLSASLCFSISYNVADAFIWQWLPGQQNYTTGSYTAQTYFSAVVQDFDARSLSCAWEHLLDSVSNFAQMGFFFV